MEFPLVDKLDQLLFWKQIVGVTGNGPYDKRAVEKIVTLEGGAVGDIDDWQTGGPIIIGREGFDKDYLEKSAELSAKHGPFIYLSQEDFWKLWLDQEYEQYYREDPRIREHAGLQFLASIGFEWPNIEVLETDSKGTGNLSERLNRFSDLRKDFGYSVRGEVTIKERCQRLGRAVKPPPFGMGLRRVAEHIAGLIRINELRHDDRMWDAIDNWESDLEWLYHTYYKGKAYSFVWPEK